MPYLSVGGMWQRRNLPMSIGSWKERRCFPTLEKLATTQTDQKLTIDDYIAQGDKVATTGRYSARVPATGKAFDCAVAHVFAIRTGKIVRFLDFADTAQMASAYTSASAASR